MNGEENLPLHFCLRASAVEGKLGGTWKGAVFMAPRRILLVSTGLLVATLFVVWNHSRAQAQAAVPSIYTSTNLKGEALKKAVIEHPEIVMQLNPEGRNLLSLIFSYQKPSEQDVQMLLEKGSDARNTDNYGNGILHFAAESSKPEIIALLVNAGADVNQTNQRGLTPLREAARAPGDNHKANAELLLSLGAHLDTFSAAALGKTSELQKLLSADPDSLNEDDSDIYDLSPIHIAVMRHQKAVLKVIADSHPKVNIFGAAALGDQSAVKDSLNQRPGIINERDRHGLTSLDWAVMAEDESMVKYLLQRGADPNACRALLLAAQNGNVEIAKLLIEHGADPSDPKKKFTADQLEGINPYRAVDPYQWAINYHHPEVAELIKQARKQD
jgi:ankyrin repeat protein